MFDNRGNFMKKQMMKINKNTVQESFSKAAESYNEYALVQNEAFYYLLEQLKKEQVNFNKMANVLDIGCGPGFNTWVLKDLVKEAQILAVDYAQEMVEYAKQNYVHKRINYKQADIEKEDLKIKFDLIIANAVFQWLENFQETLGNLKRQLHKNGLIAFSMFGPNTFCELAQVLKSGFDRNPSIAAASFYEYSKVRKIIEEIFSKVKMERQIQVKEYGSLFELLKVIKLTGTGGGGKRVQGLKWNARKLQSLEENYLKRIGKIKATYEIYYVLGYKK
jgi:malonyl-CoA O-methyltransferase